MAELVTTPREVRDVMRSWRGREQLIGLFPTMGALHRGHLSLAERSVSECDRTVVSIFVNPLQFGPAEDLEGYPRDLDADVARLDAVGVDLVFAPEVDRFLLPGHRTTVHVDGLTERLEGAARPTHFDGVTTIVSKLLNVVQPDRAYFGEKDYQQLAVVTRMVRDLDIPAQIVPCATVREADGLAMSSRNAYLSDAQRQQAVAISGALFDVRDRWSGDATRARQELRRTLKGAPGLVLDYAEICDPQTFEPLYGTMGGPARALVAAHVGAARLIDNVRLDLPR